MSYDKVFNLVTQRSFTSMIIPFQNPLLRMFSKVGLLSLEKEVKRVAHKSVKNLILTYLKNQKKTVEVKEGGSGSTSITDNQQKNLDPQKGEKEKNKTDITTPLTVAAGGVGLGAGAGIFSVLSNIPKVLTNPLVLGAMVLIFMNKK